MHGGVLNSISVHGTVLSSVCGAGCARQENRYASSCSWRGDPFWEGQSLPTRTMQMGTTWFLQVVQRWHHELCAVCWHWQ